jgi:adenine-specific DNA methylase
MYYLWVKELDCVSCGSSVPLFKDYRVGKGRYDNSGGYNVFCPSCESIIFVDDWKGESICENCDNTFVPSEGTVDRGYICQDCGQKYGVLDAIQEQGGFNIRLYGLEYYCPDCDSNNLPKSKVKAYKSITEEDISLFQEAATEWDQSEELKEFVPNENIPPGIKTDSTLFDGSIGGGHNVLRHGITKWTDMFNKRQLLSLSTLLRSIDQIEDQNVKEYLLLAFGGCLRFNSMMSGYQASRNHITNIFKSNSFDPPQKPAENNLWGTKYGMGTFEAIWEMIINGVEYAHSPTERYVENGDTKETPPFAKSIGEETSVHCGDMRKISKENEFDAIITDPPYYDNVIYSELSDYFYVWQRILLKDEYEVFREEKTPRAESIVANPAAQKGAREFEDEIRQAFNTISKALKDDGVLVFTYHHSSVESWGELLTALCDVGFEITATYPISADTAKFFEGKAVEFDIIIVARPAVEREPISWNSLRRNIYRTARKTRKRLEENRDLSRGDIGVVEMGRCFHEYSKHHGKVERAGKTMTAKEVVDEIYGVIQHGSDIGEIDVFLDLLETRGASYDDLNKLCRGTNATPERMEDMRLYRMDDGFKLGTWDDEKRIAHVQGRVDDDEELTELDKAQFLRYRWEHGKSVSEYLNAWEITDSLRELCEGLADATGDDTYRNILESRLSDY